MSDTTHRPHTSVEALAPQSISEEVLLEKYAKDDEQTILEVNQRVARALAQVYLPAWGYNAGRDDAAGEAV